MFYKHENQVVERPSPSSTDGEADFHAQLRGTGSYGAVARGTAPVWHECVFEHAAIDLPDGRRDQGRERKVASSRAALRELLALRTCDRCASYYDIRGIPESPTLVGAAPQSLLARSALDATPIQDPCGWWLQCVLCVRLI
jgi:hypothetical protein